jgi:hypothetical protein
MKIKLQEYGLINIKMMDDMIKELEGFKTGDILKDLPTRSLIGTLEGLKQQLIPAEISNEEIEKAAKECRFEDLDISVGSFELGAKWYREQLTQNKNS